MAETTSTNKLPDDMTEAELADYFYAHRDDLAGEELPSLPPRRMNVMISTRFSQAEAAELRAAADRARMSVSAFVRQRVLATLSANIIDLARVRDDLREMQSRASDALQAIAQAQPSRPSRSKASKHKPASA